MQVYLTSNGKRLRTVTYGGRIWTIAPDSGGEYEIVLDNKDYDNKLCVLSVDGRNVLDGEPAEVSDDGYVVRGNSRWPIKGWRQSDNTVAAFTFVEASQSYDNLTDSKGGAPQTIGVAVFNEKLREHTYRGGVMKSMNYGGLESFGGEVMRGGDSKGIGSARSIGTGYGDSRTMQTTEATFERASRDPAQILVVEYATLGQLKSWGIPVPPDKPNPFPGKPARNQSVPPPPGY
jgi:hypothetical protein